MKHIAILDFGSQYTHLIARTIREQNVLAKIYSNGAAAAELKKENVIGIILSGGPQSVYDEDSIRIDQNIFEMGVPILGLCYGHQLIGQMLGGEVKPGKTREFGWAELSVRGESAIFKNVSRKTQVWMSHGDAVAKAPEGFQIIGATADCPVTAMADEKKKIYGFQFHPEVAHTEEGVKMLSNFVLDICGAEKNWKADNLLADLEEKIRSQAGKKKVFILCSGGVDSNVAFALLTKALGKDRVWGLYIDTGFMRSKESEEIQAGFKKVDFDNIRSIDASKIFYQRLKNVYEPEEKRKIIGAAFLDVKDKLIEDLGLNPDEWLLGQGTIYPDTIESGATKHADKIKTHHNRVDAIQEMVKKGLVVEPLVEFYKDEVRSLGNLLGLPKDLVERHPFPGPGLAIRCLCLDAKLPKEGTREARNLTADLFSKKFPNINFEVLPIKSVGVQGDNRTYAHPLAVWGARDWKKLSEISVAATNSVRAVNRVLLLANPGAGAPEFSISENSLDLSKDRVDKLRRIDGIVNGIIKSAGIYGAIWQFPVVLIPIVDERGRESIVLRPINSRDAMTLNFYEMDLKVLDKIVGKIVATGEIGYVFYDITNKPPGTVEWE
ncbi:MAG: hypothetical protein QG620_226 [Patescibacteria group bacterium]|nr:hypothetical protein [Patescibacteria group bacterium]